MDSFSANRFVWWMFSFVPNINIDDGLITCSSCGMTFDRDSLCKIFGPEVITEVFNCVKIAQRLALSQEEMGLVKAITVFCTGKANILHICALAYNLVH